MRVIVDGSAREMRSVWFEDGQLHLIDQRVLPFTLRIRRVSGYKDAASAIRDMVVRGAPAIGCAAAYGMALAINEGVDLRKAAAHMIGARPTAHDLSYAVNWMVEMAPALGGVEAAERYADEIVARCRRIGEHGARLIKDGERILTHCNAGALATVDYGTALAPIRVAAREGKRIFVYVDETRPWLQGSRLTAWELSNEGIEHAIIADNAAGHFMKNDISMVIVGADRIAPNGDFANKIGTYEKAVVARENGIPFYVAAPSSTFDFSLSDGTGISIEERGEEELLSVAEKRIVPEGEKALNPVFDVTPARYLTAVITEEGIIRPGEIAAQKERLRVS